MKSTRQAQVQARCRDPQSQRRTEQVRPALQPAPSHLSSPSSRAACPALRAPVTLRRARRAHPPEGSGLQAGVRRTAAGGSGPGGQHHVEAVAHLGG